MTAILRFVSNIPWFVAFLLGGGLGYMGFNDRTLAELKPLDEQKMTLEGQIETIKMDIEKVKNFESDKNRLEREKDELDKAFKAAKSQFPPSVDLPGLMKQFEEIAKNLGVKILNFNPDLNIKRELLSSSKVVLRIQGNYVQGMQYMNELSRMTRVINVESVRFSNPKADSAGQLLEVEISMVTFFVGDA